MFVSKYIFSELSAILFRTGWRVSDGCRWKLLHIGISCDNWQFWSFPFFPVTNTRVCLCGQKGVYTDSELKSWNFYLSDIKIQIWMRNHLCAFSILQPGRLRAQIQRVLPHVLVRLTPTPSTVGEIGDKFHSAFIMVTYNTFTFIMVANNTFTFIMVANNTFYFHHCHFHFLF